MSTETNSINFDSYIPYYIQLIEALKAKISSGEWKPGDKIPSEPELCIYYGVSRTVVRQALREIELDGLILRKKGKGTFIAEPKINESLVEKLTGFYQDMLERGHHTVTEVLKNEIEPCTAKIAGHLHIAPGTSVFCIERLRFVDGVPIVLVTTYIPVSLCPQLADQDLSSQSLYQILERFGLVIMRAHRSIEAISATEREARLLAVDEYDPLLHLDSISYLEDGTPLEYYHAIHRGDRSRFEVDLVRLPDQHNVITKIETGTTEPAETS